MDLRQEKAGYDAIKMCTRFLPSRKEMEHPCIYSDDNVMFYLVNTKTWLNGEGQVEGNNQCPESAPPRRYKFDECSHEIFTIIKR